MSTASLVRSARRGKGLTRHELAVRVGISQPALADIERGAHDTRGEALGRLVVGAGYRLCALPTTAYTVAEWADYIYQELRSERNSFEVAYRAFIGCNDDLIAAEPALRVALCVAAPAPCGDPRFDALLAGLVEHHLGGARLPIPSWVNEPWRSLDVVWKATPYTDPAEGLEAFLRHGVELAGSELASV